MSHSTSKLPAIRACLFDMDGLLIDSEDIYTICTNKVLHEFGKPDLPWSIKAQLQGRPGPESSRIFREWAQLPISQEEFQERQKALHTKYFPDTKPLPGVPELLKSLDGASRKGRDGVYVALATSSHAANFRLKSGHLEDLFAVFPQEQRVLGDDPRIPKGRGKPAPDIYYLALETINARIRKEGGKEVYPEECLVFEDSVPGVEAGRRAGMQVVWCPHEGLLNEYKGREKEVLAGLTGELKEVDGAGDKQKRAKDVEEENRGHEGRPLRRIPGQTGEIDDGWAIFYESLENFAFDRYGIKV